MLLRIRQAGGARGLVAALGLLAVGGTCDGRRTIPPVSLASAERLEKEGKSAAAMLEYDRIAGKVAGREDLEANLALARIHRRLFEHRAWEVPDVVAKSSVLREALRVPEGGALLVRASEFYLRILSEPGGGAARAEAASFLSATLERKALEPAARLRATGDDSIHRILLLECAATFEHRRAGLAGEEPRTRLAALFRKLGEEYATMARLPKVRPQVAEKWKEAAEASSDLAMAIEREKDLPPLPEDFARLGQSSPSGQLIESTKWSDRAIKEMTQRGDVREAERCYRTAMRYLEFASEALAFPTSSQADMLSARAGIEKSWRSICFSDR